MSESFKLNDNDISAVEEVIVHIRYINPYRTITLVGVGQGFMTVSQASSKIFAISRFFSVCKSLKLKANNISAVRQVSGQIKHIKLNYSSKSH